MNKYGRVAALLAAATVWAASVAAGESSKLVSTFDDIHYWIGEGTNRVAIVIDFNDTSVKDTAGNQVACSYVWGFRWNGQAPSIANILFQIAEDDPNFTADITDSGWINGFTYDFDEDGLPDFAPESWSEFEYDENNIPLHMIGDDWAASFATGIDFKDLTWEKSGTGASGMYPQNGQWFVQRFAAYAMDVNNWSYIVDEFMTSVNPMAPERYFHMGDIKYWIGSGTNRCAIVVDFNDDGESQSSFAWGYRWNGESLSVMEILNKIALVDPRFSVYFTASGSIEECLYDRDDDGQMELTSKSEQGYDEESGHVNGRTWMVACAAGEVFHNLNWAKIEKPVNEIHLQNKQWIVQKFASYVKETEENGGMYLVDEYIPTKMATGAEPSHTMISILPSVDGNFYASLTDAFEMARGGNTVLLPEEGMIDEASKSVSVGSGESGTLQTYVVPVYYDMVVSGSSVSLTLNAVATPTFTADPASAMKPFSVDGDKVTVVPGNVIDGLYYGLLSATDLAKGFSEPKIWVRAENGSVVLEAVKTGGAGFYKVKVSDIAR